MTSTACRLLVRVIAMNYVVHLPLSSFTLSSSVWAHSSHGNVEGYLPMMPLYTTQAIANPRAQPLGCPK